MIYFNCLNLFLVVSIFGAFATLICIVAIVVLSFMVWTSDPTPYSHKILDLPQIPFALATIAFSYGGNNVFPHIEESMRKPRHWNRVVTASLCTCAIMYSLVAFSGYLAYGDHTKNPILESLPEGKCIF